MVGVSEGNKVWVLGLSMKATLRVCGVGASRLGFGAWESGFWGLGFRVWVRVCI